MIELKNVSKYYHNGTVTNMGLHNVSLKMNRGEIIAITGDSGSGKSTLLNVITKIDTFDEGEILYMGNETSYFSVSDMDDFRKNKIGFIFQNYNIIDSYTVLENVMLPLTLKGMKKNEARKKALELIEKVGLKDRVKSRGSKLSGGEKQRCVIARALASDCDILACDEPTGNLDSKTGEEIIKLIAEAAKDKLVLIVTHNFDQVKDIVTRKIKVTDGTITEDVTYKEVPDDEVMDLNLDYVPLKRSVALTVAKNNVFFTPRKTILLMLIFLAIWFSSLFMYQAIGNSFNASNYSSVYVDSSPNRGVAYMADHSALDEDALYGYTYYKNAFAMDHKVTVANNMFSTCYYSDAYSYTLVSGNEPSNDKEALLLVSSYMTDYYSGPNYSESFKVMNKDFTISGIGVIDDAPMIPVLAGNEKLESLMNASLILSNLSIKSSSKTTAVNNAVGFEGSSCIILPSSWKDLDVSLYLYNMYDVTDYFKVEYSDMVEEPYYCYSDDSFMEDMPLLEASIYDKNISWAATSLGRKGITVDVCSKTSDASELQKFIANIMSYFVMILASQVLILVFIITYIILSRVYASKKKDYEILRTLGVTKHDMKHIVNYEVIGCGMASVVFSFVVFVILLYAVPSLYSSLGNLLWGTVIIYFVLSFLFTWLIARRFNRKLFKFSVTKSLKGDAR